MIDSNNIPNNRTRNNNSSTDFLFNILEFFLSGIATSFEVLIRKDFGERYFTFSKYLIGLVIVAFFAMMANINFTDLSYFYGYKASLYSVKQTQSLPNFSYYFFLAYLLAYFYLGLVEIRKGFIRSRDGDLWHSFFNGQSRLPLFDEITQTLGLKRMLGEHIIANHIVQLYIEPLFLLGLGIVLSFVFPLVGVWFVLGSIIIFLRSQMIYARLKVQYLDMNDGQIESSQMNKAVKGENPNKTQGLTTMAIRPTGFQNGINVFSPNTQDLVQKVFSKNPHLAKMAGVETVENETIKTVNLAKKAPPKEQEEIKKEPTETENIPVEATPKPPETKSKILETLTDNSPKIIVDNSFKEIIINSNKKPKPPIIFIS